MRRRVDPAAFGPRRVVVRFDFAGVAQGKRRWWLVNEGGSVDLCPKDPGHEVDLYVAAPLRKMVEVWVGALPLDAALRGGAIELAGSRALQRQFKAWLLLSPFARKSGSHPPHRAAAAPASAA